MRVANDHSLLVSDVLLGTFSLVDLFSLSRFEEFRASLVGIVDTSRVESLDSDGGYFVVFDARYGELEYLPFQTEGTLCPALRSSTDFTFTLRGIFILTVCGPSG